MSHLYRIIGFIVCGGSMLTIFIRIPEHAGVVGSAPDDGASPTVGAEPVDSSAEPVDSSWSDGSPEAVGSSSSAANMSIELEAEDEAAKTDETDRAGCGGCIA